MSNVYAADAEQTAPVRRRGEGMRILWFLLIAMAVHICMSLGMTWSTSMVNDMLDHARYGNGWWDVFTVGETARLWTFASWLLGLLAEIGTALLQRAVTFRSRAGWYWTIPAVIGVSLAFDLLNSLIWNAVGESIINSLAADGGMTVVGAVTIVSSIWSGVGFVLWLIVSYVFQRFVLYRRTLDTNGLVRR